PPAVGRSMSVFLSLDTYDVRFPTSRELDGSDAMNPDPDYSAAYVVLRTDHEDGLEGHGFAFTIGRGNDVEAAAIEALRPYLVGRSVEGILADLGGFWKELVHDSQLRWLGPEKGVMHMAISAVVNAIWDLAAKRAGMPLWLLLAQMSPEDIVALVDFRYLTDALTPEDALDILRKAEPGRRTRARRHRPGHRAHQGGHRGARPEPGHLQADAAGRRAVVPATRRGPGGRRQRERRDPVAGGQVRRTGVPARRWCRALRA